MRTSAHRVLTTHTGSLPRPPALLAAMHGGDPSALAAQVRRAVTQCVKSQVEAGIDVVSDGEMSKPSYATYVTQRLTGFAGQGAMPMPADLRAFPDYAQRLFADPALTALQSQACTGEIRFVGQDAVRRDIETMKAALAEVRVEEAFLTSASPGVISLFQENRYYPSHERYVHAIADAMREEYRAIHEAGFILQIDAPDLAMGRHMQFPDADLRTFRRHAQMHVEALNAATADIPADRMRLHLCWGNYEGPHHLDVALRDIIDIVIAAKPAGISFEAANGRHAHERDVWADVTLPEDKILIPGVIESTSNRIEHPELVEHRIVEFAILVGRERVIAGTDCGFGTFAGMTTVEPSIAWAKLRALSEGARRASERLWRAAKPSGEQHAAPPR